MIETTKQALEKLIESEPGWIDVSMPVRDNMLQGNREPLVPRVEHIRCPAKGDASTLTQININSHNGTHIDAPRHLIPDGTSIDKMPLETVIGPARVIEIKDPHVIDTKELALYDIQPRERLLFKTKSSYRPERLTTLTSDYVWATRDTISFLAEKRVRCVGIDYISLANASSQQEIDFVHLTLFRAGAFIIEDLYLTNVQPGNYFMICLPLNIIDGDAGPCRAVLTPL